jgi:hypothetical protein
LEARIQQEDRKMTVAIIGGGVSAAYVYQACQAAGVESRIFALDLMTSPPPGAFWLYELPPQWDDGMIQAHIIRITYMGTPEGYNRKLYGDTAIKSSFPAQEQYKFGWEPREWMPRMWDGAVFEHSHITSDRQLGELANEFPLVITTIPLPSDARRQPSKVELCACTMEAKFPTNMIIYNGVGAMPNVRSSLLFGWLSHECVRQMDFTHNICSGAMGTRITKLHPKSKILKDVQLEHEQQPRHNIVRIGRYAQWNRKILAHECYAKTTNLLRACGLSGRSSVSTTSPFAEKL